MAIHRGRAASRQPGGQPGAAASAAHTCRPPAQGYIAASPAAADAGFGVGHTRLTQTKGVWMWGEPVEVSLPSGEKTNVSAALSRVLGNLSYCTCMAVGARLPRTHECMHRCRFLWD